MVPLIGCSAFSFGWGAQFVVDHLKHAFLCKYNEIQPNVFRDYLAELCRRTTRFSVHKVHRLVNTPSPRQKWKINANQRERGGFGRGDQQP